MTDKPTPTDAELFEVIREAARGGTVRCDGSTSLRIARAVLAKWGTPAGAEEPVAWLRNTTDPQPHAVTNLKYRSALDAKAGVEYIPVFAAPQPVAREPLTPERVKEIVRGAGYDQCGIPDTERAAFINGLRHGERAHGIKGGQHGTE